MIGPVIFWIVAAIVCVWLSKVCLDNYGCDKLTDNWSHFSSIADKHGFQLKQLPSRGSDAAPCEIEFELSGPTFRYVARGWRTLRAVRRVHRGQLDVRWMERHSTYEHSELP